MWRNVGIERTGARLRDAGEMFDFWGRYTMDKIFDEPDGWEVQNMITVAALLGRAAAWRTETRCAHARTDFPASDDGLLAHALWSVGCPEPRLVRVGARAEAMVG